MSELVDAIIKDLELKVGEMDTESHRHLPMSVKRAAAIAKLMAFEEAIEIVRAAARARVPG